MQEVVSWDEDQKHWYITFLRSLNEWKEEGVLRLLALLADMKAAFEVDDKVLWPMT